MCLALKEADPIAVNASLLKTRTVAVRGSCGKPHALLREAAIQKEGR